MKMGSLVSNVQEIRLLFVASGYRSITNLCITEIHNYDEEEENNYQ